MYDNYNNNHKNDPCVVSLCQICAVLTTTGHSIISVNFMLGMITSWICLWRLDPCHHWHRLSDTSQPPRCWTEAISMSYHLSLSLSLCLSVQGYSHIRVTRVLSGLFRHFTATGVLDGDNNCVHRLSVCPLSLPLGRLGL